MAVGGRRRARGRALVVAALVAVTGALVGSSVVGAAPLATPTISTTPGQTAVTLSASTPPVLTDSALLTGGSHPSGTITFTLLLGSTTVDTETATVHGDATYVTSKGYTLLTTGTVTGTYQWDASYGGDSANNSVSDTNNAGEQVVVSDASPSLSTTPSPTSLTLSGPTPPTLTDSATLSAGYHPTGMITFKLFYGTTLVDTETAGVHGNGTVSTPTGYTPATPPTDPNEPTITGTYQWQVSYGGDPNDKTASDLNNPGEQTVISSASPSLSTTPDPTSVTLSGPTPPTLTDSATLSGGFHPGGFITFTLYYGSTMVGNETATVHGNNTYSTPTGYMPPTDQSTVVGLYQWDASYGGDGNNIGAVDTNNTNEQATVEPAQPLLSTAPNATAVTLGPTDPTLTDSATLSGGYHPAGTITFTLYDGATAVDTETATVHGNNTYSTPTGYTLPMSGPVTGTYQWDATYGGDANNNDAPDINDPAEVVVVSNATPSLSTMPSPSVVNAGVTATTTTDSATLSGGYYPGGSITFTLVRGGTTLDTETVAVSGNGTYNTPLGFPIPAGTAPGITYQWDASYSGSTNNDSVTDDDAVDELVTVGTPCAFGQTYHFLTATVKAPGSGFTGYFCVNAAGSGNLRPERRGPRDGNDPHLGHLHLHRRLGGGSGPARTEDPRHRHLRHRETAPLPMKTGTFTLHPGRLARTSLARLVQGLCSGGPRTLSPGKVNQR